MLKVWGRSNSINVQKVMWVVAELKLPHERVDAGMQYGGVNETWYRDLNPNGRVPTIDDAGFVLWESNAIVRYLAGKHDAGGLAPIDAHAHADADRWMDWVTSTVHPVMTPLFWGLIRTAPEQRDPRSIQENAAAMEGLAGILDKHLSTRPYMAGDALSMGDVPVGCFIYRWNALPIERPHLPHLAAWYARLTGRPAFREHVMLPLT